VNTPCASAIKSGAEFLQTGKPLCARPWHPPFTDAPLALRFCSRLRRCPKCRGDKVLHFCHRSLLLGACTRRREKYNAAVKLSPLPARRRADVCDVSRQSDGRALCATVTDHGGGEDGRCQACRLSASALAALAEPAGSSTARELPGSGVPVDPMGSA